MINNFFAAWKAARKEKKEAEAQARHRQEEYWIKNRMTQVMRDYFERDGVFRPWEYSFLYPAGVGECRPRAGKIFFPKTGEEAASYSEAVEVLFRLLREVEEVEEKERKERKKIASSIPY